MPMTKKLAKYSSPRHLLNRILEEPGLVSIIQRLDAKVLGSLVEHIGLEDSGEILSLATTEQINKVFDLDLWRNEKPGKEEHFDADRFGVWLEILLEMGAAFAARRIAELDEDFLTMALSQHILVIDIDELATRMSSGFRGSRTDDEMLEKALESGLSHEFEEFRAISKNHRSWDAVLTLLVELDGEHHDLLRTLLERCHYISTEYIEDNGGLYDVLTAEEQIQMDVAYEREQRREKEGYVSPATATSFLSLIRISRMDELLAARDYDTVTQAYFKSFAPSSQPQPKSNPPANKAGGGPGDHPGEMPENASGFIQLLKEAGVISTPQSTLLLQDAREGSQPEKYPLIRSALLALREADARIHTRRMGELNYLANVLVSGCGFLDRAFRPGEAAEAALATCNLGLQYLLEDSAMLGRILREHDAIKIFRIGWLVLHQGVSMHATRQLVAALPALASSGDSWIKQQLDELGTALRTQLAKDKPWEAQDKIDVLGTVLDQAAVQALKYLIAEYPSLPGAEAEFIYDKAQIEKIHRFLTGLVKN